MLFLANRIHVNVEKPIAETSAQGKELVTLAAQKKLCLGVGHSERFNPAFQYLYERKSGVRYLEMHRHAPYKTRGADVSVLHDLMIHDMDLLMSLVGEKFKILSASGGCLVSKTYDWANCTLQFESGLQALVTTSRLAAQMTRSIKAVFADKVININLQTGQVEQTANSLSIEGLLQTTSIDTGKGDNLLTETASFIQSILDKKPAVISGSDGLRALQAVEDIIARIQT
jgi:predicted dehydrogenase